MRAAVETDSIVLAKDDNVAEAIATAKKAFEAGKASQPPVGTAATGKLVAAGTGK